MKDKEFVSDVWTFKLEGDSNVRIYAMGQYITTMNIPNLEDEKFEDYCKQWIIYNR
ncbi:MAG: hypothetical protein RR620_08885 [Clostridium sp.]